MIDPISVSENIRNGYIDYITTSFHFADTEYGKLFDEQLRKNDHVSKGPFLEMSGSYESGHSLKELVSCGKASTLFGSLEHCPEKEKELKIDRPLYLHQEAALEKIRDGQNIIVTTGTGSGKTECFLIPIIDDLLEKEKNGTLSNSVQAIIIYPMNALANDQMKRMRLLLKDHPAIRFGLYNGNTPHTHAKGISTYKKTVGPNSNPLENEVLSREDMQQNPPHILITNYSMMEYILLRPKDDALFFGAELKFIVLDEAHIYRGATGIETSMLLRRMRARIPNRGIQYILTSATLGGPEDNEQIVRFGENLCGVNFKQQNIIRSKEKQPIQADTIDFPPQIWQELSSTEQSVSATLKKYNAVFTDSDDEAEQLASLFLHSKAYSLLRTATDKPRTINEISDLLCREMNISPENVTAMVNVCARAEHEGSALIRAKYHFFIRALEGAYITAGRKKQLFLNRCSETVCDGKTMCVFEAAICTDCGRLALAGKIEDGFLVQHSAGSGDDGVDFFVIQNEQEETWAYEDDTAADNDSEDYIVCTVCGACAANKGNKTKLSCEHDTSDFIRVHKARVTDSGKTKCPACGTGSMRRVYLGNDAATSVLATELYEQLPQQETEYTEDAADTQIVNDFFGVIDIPKYTIKEKARQFLCFSDSRSEAANFACYMENSYSEFIRRRGVWQAADDFRAQGKLKVSADDFIKELISIFETNRSFLSWDEKGQSASPSAKRNALIALMNEIYSTRRDTGLISMGVFSLCYWPNIDLAKRLAAKEGKPEQEILALLNLLIMDAVYTGALSAKENILLDADREYIFYTRTPQKLVLVKQGSAASRPGIHGWCARPRKEGSYYPNTKVTRIREALGYSDDKANAFLKAYWQIINKNHTEEFTVNISDFDILLYPFEQMPFYRCKRCGKVTPYNVSGKCANVHCGGALELYDARSATGKNHYAKLYNSAQMKPLYIKEHTAQLSKNQQSIYQTAFVKQEINALSCSTTFEMGVDVGSLETVYLRNVPPNPSNYVQRAGRAGRKKGSAAFVLTYAKLSSHDFTFYARPEEMISGKISAPIFALENEKIIRRHIYAVALSYFFKAYPDFYNSDDRNAFLLSGGFEQLCAMLEEKPDDLKALLQTSIPLALHERFGINDFSWVQPFIGEDGVLSLAYNDFHSTIKELEKEINSVKGKNLQEASMLEKQLKMFRASGDDDKGKRSLIDFLVRANVLPKYGFPVDTVEMYTGGNMYGSDDDKQLNLMRDLQMAISEYAPGCEVVADGHMYKSRYIRKLSGKKEWEYGWCAECSQCHQQNYSRIPITSEGKPCISCGMKISKTRWRQTVSPRMGFISDRNQYEVPMRRPEKAYRTDDYYIGDQQRKTIDRQEFRCNGKRVTLESTTNDSLAILGKTEYFVCPYCGYADENELTAHKNPHGSVCKYSNTGKRLLLSHDFRTDVVKICFHIPEANNDALMLSVMYALLSGLSSEMGIERNDIKGCLHMEKTTELGMLYSLILYDAVAGGAGHVRRMVTADGSAFTRVIGAAVRMLKNCSCQSSCYNCLRNYYNQKMHDKLDRLKALEFLEKWQSDFVSESLSANECNETDTPSDESAHCKLSVVKEGMNCSAQSYRSLWEYMSEDASEPSEVEFFTCLVENANETEECEKPYRGICQLKNMAQIDAQTITCSMLWKDKKILMFTSENETDFKKALSSDWTCICTTGGQESAQRLIHLLKGE